MRVRTASSVIVLIEMDQEDALNLGTELDAALSEQTGGERRWPLIRELESHLETEAEEEEEVEEEEEEEQDECDCEGVKYNPTDLYCHACGGRLRDSQRRKKKAKPRKVGKL